MTTKRQQRERKCHVEATRVTVHLHGWGAYWMVDLIITTKKGTSEINQRTFDDYSKALACYDRLKVIAG